LLFYCLIALTEAFRAFRNFRRGEEDADDYFSLGSPVPRNVSETAVGQETVGQETVGQENVRQETVGQQP
jgi:hypothetical protein